MKHLLLTTIAAVVLVGCGPQPPDISIHKAAEEGNIEAVKQHLAAGTDVNAKDTVMVATPLHHAADGGQKKTAELLIAAGADVNTKDDGGDTPLDWAISYKRTEIADLLRKHGGKAKAPDIDIHTAAMRGNIEAVKQHLAAGTDVNAHNLIRTPLNYAAQEGHNQVVELLIANGADVNAKDKNHGKTPLNYAAQEGHNQVVELLIANGADVNARDSIGETPLHWAAEKGQKEIVELLIAAGADMNAIIVNSLPRRGSGRWQGMTPLDWAIRWNQTEIADLLRKHGAKRGQ